MMTERLRGWPQIMQKMVDKEGGCPKIMQEMVGKKGSFLLERAPPQETADTVVLEGMYNMLSD